MYLPDIPLVLVNSGKCFKQFSLCFVKIRLFGRYLLDLGEEKCSKLLVNRSKDAQNSYVTL